MSDLYLRPVYHAPGNNTVLPPWDFRAFAGGREIEGVEFLVPVPLTIENEELVDGVAAVMVSGGAVGDEVIVTARCTLDTGESVDSSYRVFVVSK